MQRRRLGLVAMLQDSSVLVRKLRGQARIYARPRMKELHQLRTFDLERSKEAAMNSMVGSNNADMNPWHGMYMLGNKDTPALKVLILFLSR